MIEEIKNYTKFILPTFGKKISLSQELILSEIWRKYLNNGDT